MMIDFETLSTEPNAVCLSIGIQAFDRTRLGSSLYLVLNASEQQKSGRHVSASTKDWWSRQAAEAKKVLEESEKSAEPMVNSLKKVRDFIDSFNPNKLKPSVKVWGNGSIFDIVILESLFKQYGLSIPWSFWDVRDLRTFTDCVANARFLPKNTALAHNALADATHQAQFIIDTYRKLSDQSASLPGKFPPNAMGWAEMLKGARGTPTVYLMKYQKPGCEPEDKEILVLDVGKFTFPKTDGTTGTFEGIKGYDIKKGEERSYSFRGIVDIKAKEE